MKKLITILFEAIGRLFSYVFNMKLIDIPYNVAMFIMCFVFAYMASLVIIGFPCAVWKDITKKEIDDEAENKVTRVVAIFLGVLFLLFLVWGKTEY